jgi:hypothetical protein
MELKSALLAGSSTLPDVHRTRASPSQRLSRFKQPALRLVLCCLSGQRVSASEGGSAGVGDIPFRPDAKGPRVKTRPSSVERHRWRPLRLSPRVTVVCTCTPSSTRTLSFASRLLLSMDGRGHTLSNEAMQPVPLTARYRCNSLFDMRHGCGRRSRHGHGVHGLSGHGRNTEQGAREQCAGR